MEKRWTKLKKIDTEKIEKLSNELNKLHPSLSEILVRRGVNSFEKAKSYFRPSIEETHDPFLMKNMDKALERLERAIEKEEKVLVYGDYDVDGTTAVALVYSYLNNYYTNIDYYIPDRYTEGYGISIQGIDFAKENDFSLIIALDCGIKANDKIDYANGKGIDFIICDHHTPGEEIPQAIAVLDPKQKDCNYPFKELSGCGVGYKLMEAWSINNKHSLELLLDKLDILAVSICADIVPMVGENRVYTYYGLRKLNANPQAGFKAMLDIAQQKKKNLNVTDVVFTLAPRINAAGRMESGKKAVEVMLSETAAAAMQEGNNINAQNNERKDLDRAITQEALAEIEHRNWQERKSTVLFNAEWHKGVIGIVASRCIEHYYRPTVILTESEGKAAGSARSVSGFSVYDALEECKDVLTQFGGHMYAAGMTLPLENIEAFQNKFEEVVSRRILPEQLIPEIEIDAELNLNDINFGFYKILKQFTPFGPQNMKPVFWAKNLRDRGYAKIVGENHLRMTLEQKENPSKAFAGIAFGQADKLELIKSGEPFDVLFSLEENEWQGKVSLQLMVKDIRITND